MATAYLRAESVPVILPHNFAQAAAVMAQFDRSQIASAIEVLVNLLDVLDGDPDREGECSEDELSSFPTHVRLLLNDGPGCMISDPDFGVDDQGEPEETDRDDGYYDNDMPIRGGGSGDCQ